MKRFIALILVVFTVSLVACANETINNANDVSGAQSVAREFVEKSPTYSFDGQNLKQNSYVIQESFPERHIFEFEFISSHGGYGDRMNLPVLQVMTPHIARVVVVDGDVVEAVLDDTWDMLNQRPVSESGRAPLKMSYSPVQCVETPWESWHAEGKIKYLVEPSNEQLIVDYYAQEYDIHLFNVKKVERSEMVCMACETCSRTYYFTADVQEGDVAKLQELNWSAYSDEATVPKK